MTIVATPPAPVTAPVEPEEDDVPIVINRAGTRVDKAFRFALASSSMVVLLILVGVVVFLAANGWKALAVGGIHFITDDTWSPDSGHFGAGPLLLGSIAIAVVAVVIAGPISLAAALMINEYAPIWARGFLTGVVDCLATVPSIVYGFWGLALISNLQAAPAQWLVAHFGFVPFIRTPSPGQFGDSIFACGLVCSVTLIPIITSISREVMSQTPREACEGALGLGGTRWGMVTDVIFPFSRNGIVGAFLLGFGRGLGETMIVVLILSQRNIYTWGIMGPNGLGSIAKQITEDFTTGTALDKSALILLGLVLFLITLLVNLVARTIVNRGGSSK
ncbi:MAG: phosphate ABC transporter permease subunit PstC [Acidimicrobiales bacterium]|jgi:phosphate transport system permease protein